MSFGIMTAPSQVDYADIQRVWHAADEHEAIDHAWLFDHLLPIFGPADGPIFEGWTLLSAMAAQTRRLRLGLLVTSNRIRPPALLAKIAATVDVISDGRLDVGIGAGSRTDIAWARREYDAHGLPYHSAADAVAGLDEACTVLRRLWTSDEPFDFHGEHVHVTGAYGNPKPVQRPSPPLVIGGRATRTLRVAAMHADIVNIPGETVADAAARSARLDACCAEIGRDPSEITRSFPINVDYAHPDVARDTIKSAVDAGFAHLVLVLPAPYPEHVVDWLADEVIAGGTG